MSGQKKQFVMFSSLRKRYFDLSWMQVHLLRVEGRFAIQLTVMIFLLCSDGLAFGLNNYKTKRIMHIPLFWAPYPSHVLYFYRTCPQVWYEEHLSSLRRRIHKAYHSCQLHQYRGIRGSWILSVFSIFCPSLRISMMSWWIYVPYDSFPAFLCWPNQTSQ